MQVRKSSPGMKRRIINVGEIKTNYNTGETIYFTTRNFIKNQIYFIKKKWFSVDGKGTLEADNVIGISSDVCEQLEKEGVDYIIFQIMNFPELKTHWKGKISLQNFMDNSIEIEEISHDKQRVIDIEKLER